MAGGHADILKVHHVGTNKHKNRTEFGKYLKMSKMKFLALNYDTSDGSLWIIV